MAVISYLHEDISAKAISMNENSYTVEPRLVDTLPQIFYI